MSFFNRNPMSGAMPPADPYDIYGVFGGGDPLGSVDLFGGAPQAPQPYQDPYSGYQDPYSGYQDPYASYQDPHAGYQDPFSDIDLFGAGRSGQQGSMFGAPMGYMPEPMSSTTAVASGTGGPAAPAPGAADTVYAGGTPGFDERTGQYTQQPPQGGDGGASLPPPSNQPTFYAGDTPFATRQEAIDHARNVLKDPDAVQYVGAGQTRPPQMTAEEKRAAEERRLEGLRRFEESRRRVEEFKNRKQALIDQYSGRDIEGGYGLEGRGFENVRFSNLEEAMDALRALNEGGRDPNNLAVSYDRLVNMGAGPMFAVSQGLNQRRLDMPRFSNREDAINYLMRERGFDRARAERNVRQKN